MNKLSEKVTNILTDYKQGEPCMTTGLRIEVYNTEECVQAILTAMREVLPEEKELDSIMKHHFGILVNSIPRKLCAKAIVDYLEGRCTK